MKSLIVSLAFMSVFFFPKAQDFCGQHIIEKQMRDSDAQLNQAFLEYHSDIFTQQIPSGERAELIIIPVVFHIIHENGPENISDAQIHDAMRILNEDYAATNEELTEVATAFVDDIGTADIEFRLAQKDPSGNSTSGIERIFSNETNVGDDGSKLNPWPRDQYLNIWVTDVIYISGAAAYAYRPPAADGNPDGDGIISNHRYVGTIGTASGTSGKTLTHEIGHYLGLPHTWGETNAPGCDGSDPNPPCDGNNNCNLDDGISDTPNCLGVSNSNCQLERTTCGSLDNIQNYMDYSSCEAMFTKGQVTVMRNSLNSSVAEREELWTSSNLEATGVTSLSKARFYVANSRGHCVGDTIKLYDESTHGATSWEWKIEGPAQYSSTEENPTIVIGQPGVFSVELTVSDGENTRVYKEEKAIMISNTFGFAVPFQDDFSTDANWVTDNNLEEDLNDTWEHVNNVGNNGDGCYKMNALGSGPNLWDDLIISSVDMRPLTRISISFDVAYAQINTTDVDKLSLEVSTDCGDTWRSLWSRSGSDLSVNTPLSLSEFVPTDEDWETFTINNLPTIWFSGTSMFRFRFESDFGNHLYLDNFNIDGEYTLIPQLVYPINNAQNQGGSTKVDWRAIPNVDSYEIEIDESEDFNSSALQTSINTYISESSDNEDTEYLAKDLTHGVSHFCALTTRRKSVKKIYHLSSCNTCQRILKETGTEGFEVVDVKEQLISPEDLDRAKEKFGSYESLFNKRAMKYRQRGLNEQDLSDEQFRELILEEYTFMKRPIYFVDEDIFAGNAKKTVEEIKNALSE
jgi:arsenate reductase-like glutaredoxin family protein